MVFARLGSASVVSFVLAACSHAAPPSAENATTIAADPSASAAPAVAAMDAGLGPAASTASLADAGSAPSIDPMNMTASPDPVDASAGPDFGACTADSDCVAVKKNACCNHGEMEAVAASHAADYKASFKCTQKPRPMCPMFMKVDGRVAICDGSTQHCAMAAPSDVACGGAAGAHKCPSGLHCGADNKCSK